VSACVAHSAEPSPFMVQVIRSDSAERGAVRPNRSSVESMFERQLSSKLSLEQTVLYSDRAARFAKCLVK